MAKTDTIPPEQKEMTWGTCLGDMGCYNVDDLEAAIARYKDQKNTRTVPMADIPETLQTILPFINQIEHFTMLESQLSGQILTDILSSLSFHDTEAENRRLYLINECGDGLFNLMFHFDGIRLYTIKVVLDMEYFTTESLVKAWEACKEAQEARIEQRMLSEFFWKAVRVDWPLLKRQKVSLSEVATFLAKSPDNRLKLRGTDMDGILHWIDTMQEMVVEVGAMHKDKVFATEGEIAPDELPEISPMVIYLDEPGALAWDMLSRKFMNGVQRVRREQDLSTQEVYDKPDITADLVEQAVSRVMDDETFSAGVDELEKLGLLDRYKKSLTITGLNLVKRFL